MLAVIELNSKQEIFNRVVRLMGNRFEISVVGENGVWAEDRMDSAIAEISRIEKMLSTFADDSVINKINRNAGIKPVKVSGEIFRLIDRSLKISELTQGAFDITYLDRNSANFTEEQTINYLQVALDAKNTTVFLTEKGMRIGFGAISKGYAADRAKYILQMEGVSSGVINAGGDLLTWGLQPDNEPWTTAIADTDQPMPNFNISNLAIATSGHAEKYAFINSGMIGNDETDPDEACALKSVSIISPSAELADAMATPVMMMGVKAGMQLINKLNQLACIIIDDSNKVYTSKAVQLLN
jgi:thiamine biosynthesis lipoprotein